MDINDIDAMYDAGPTKINEKLFKCPVCNKTYKTKNGATKHVAKRDCYDAAAMFRGKTGEYTAFSLYKQVCSELGHRSTFNGFKKSPAYKPALRFLAYTILHGYTAHRESLLGFVMDSNNLSTPTKVFTYAMYEETIVKYKTAFHTFGSPLFAERRTQIISGIESSDTPGKTLALDLSSMVLSYHDVVNDPYLKRVAKNSPQMYYDQINHIKNMYVDE